jgi:hypothetical protein
MSSTELHPYEIRVIKRSDSINAKWTSPTLLGALSAERIALKAEDKNTLHIEFNPQGYGKGILQIVKEFLGFMDARHGIYYGATKCFAGDYYVFRQPFDGATMLSGVKTSFVWEDDKAENIVVINSKGEEVFK